MYRPCFALAALIALTACAKKADEATTQHAPEKTTVCADSAAPIAVDGGWLRAVAAEGGNTAAYFVVCNNTDAPISIVGAASDLARAIEIHRTIRDENDVVRMAPAGDVTVEPGASVAFEPGGLHVMMMGVAEPLAEGAERSVALRLADGSVIEIALQVKSLASAETDADEHSGH
jgi:copper(I)-binding protein